MYREVWRIQRDFLYDPGFHGLDLATAVQQIRAVPGRHRPPRHDLNYLFDEMLGELTLGHVYIGGGDVAAKSEAVQGRPARRATTRSRTAATASPASTAARTGTPHLRAPLTQPGVNVKEGEYLLAVNGSELRAADNIYQLLRGHRRQAGRPQGRPDRRTARARARSRSSRSTDERSLRNLAWVEDNRRKVDEMTGGQVAYVYLPDTAAGGYTSFNRYFFAQVGKEGAVIDERFNGGGFAADYIIDYLRRPLLNYVDHPRRAKTSPRPSARSSGPKVMLINEYAGSGGDALPWYFRKPGIGPLVGKRTWGGLVGICGYPPLIGRRHGDRAARRLLVPGGRVGGGEPRRRAGHRGRARPAAWRRGHDPQLEKAVQVALDLLEKNPPPRKPKRPAYPDYHPVP